ncbi:hypothetical protein GCM10010156_48840 [Planobispora rosea]|uniref:Uncharacterized protein n=1 Tax=Planobispora rosea TaxID=35762 RepID=A0A8J3S5B1_PLARO|nr:hypothetical protein [Planobispora rosea]GGS84462.1 hypothetical protein GCM10010156_48840 [Planobispora rosea]GIH86395.1 hypothetical protein Pro02_48030 [Planobispora rosea]
MGGRMSEVAEAIDALADDLVTSRRPWWRRWRGRRSETGAFPADSGASVALPAPAPQESACRCVWQGGTCVESCPAHTPEAFLAGVDARLETYNQQMRRWWRWGR